MGTVYSDCIRPLIGVCPIHMYDAIQHTKSLELEHIQMHKKIWRIPTQNQAEPGTSMHTKGHDDGLIIPRLNIQSMQTQKKSFDIQWIMLVISLSTVDILCIPYGK